MANFKYSQVADWLKNQIYSGNYPGGVKIPGEEELCIRFSVSRQTARQAIRVLENEGLLYKVQGSGTYVSRKIQGPPFRSEGKERRCIGVIMNRTDNYLCPFLIQGIHDALCHRGYGIQLFLSSQQIALEEQFLRTVLDGGVQGIIMEPVKSALPVINDELYEKLTGQLPVVFTQALHTPYPASAVTVDDRSGGELLVKHLFDKGHRKIGAICKMDEQTGTRRYEGYMRALLKLKLTVNNEQVIWYSSETEDELFEGRQGEGLWEKIKDCTAVLCHNDRIAFYLIRFLEDRGIRVPEDMAVTGFDDTEYADVGKQITTIIHPKETLGRKAAEIVLKMIEEPDYRENYCFSAVLKPGRST
ncbi:GntR family transcriptional regulator [uncultured Robinsoniella sp.]|uniref:GntR family transcriptional regulator n=1 Tax=uncultured Robinsoniella sp. TaxID=904190 RepID=UPI00374E964E